MWLVFGIAGVGLLINGFSVSVQNVMHQIYQGVYVVGGLLMLGMAVVSWQLSGVRDRLRTIAQSAEKAEQQGVAMVEEMGRWRAAAGSANDDVST